MELFLKIAVFVFGVLGAVLIVAQYRSIYKRKTVAQSVQQNSEISAQLRVLDTNNAPTAKAKAIIALMMSCYILIHLMGNQGNKYNDKKQVERFREHWPNHQLKRLNALDEDNYDY